MTGPVRFEGDLAELPTHAYGHKSLTWWGVVAFMLIEGAGFLLACAAYFFLMSQEASWPPQPVHPPSLLPGTLFTLVLLLSELPNILIERAAVAEKLPRVQIGLIVMSLIGALLLVVRGFEFAHLNVSWTDNAYGSIIWTLLLLHTVHILTDWVDTLVLTALMFTEHGRSARRFVDVAENSLYWHFVVLTWLPLYVLIYLVPRFV